MAGNMNPDIGWALHTSQSGSAVAKCCRKLAHTAKKSGPDTGLDFQPCNVYIYTQYMLEISTADDDAAQHGTKPWHSIVTLSAAKQKLSLGVLPGVEFLVKINMAQYAVATTAWCIARQKVVVAIKAKQSSAWVLYKVSSSKGISTQHNTC